MNNRGNVWPIFPEFNIIGVFFPFFSSNIIYIFSCAVAQLWCTFKCTFLHSSTKQRNRSQPLTLKVVLSHTHILTPALPPPPTYHSPYLVYLHKPCIQCTLMVIVALMLLCYSGNAQFCVLPFDELHCGLFGSSNDTVTPTSICRPKMNKPGF